MRMIGMLIVACLVVYLGLKEFQSNGPQSPSISTAINQADANVALTNLQGAASVLAARLVSDGTYAGAAIAGVTLVRADATSYCVQAPSGATFEHLAGPNGTPAPGPC